MMTVMDIVMVIVAVTTCTMTIKFILGSDVLACSFDGATAADLAVQIGNTIASPAFMIITMTMTMAINITMALQHHHGHYHNHHRGILFRFC